VDRWVLWWYRYDDERHERRNTVVSAFTDRAEFEQRMAEAADLLARLKAEGTAEPVERISGGFHPAGYRAEVQARRSGLKKDIYFVTRRSESHEADDA
jgi:hypothetical protein